MTFEPVFLGPMTDSRTPWATAPWTPRDWQRASVKPIGQALHDGKSPLVSAVMGSGKSILLSEIVYQVSLRLEADECIVVGAPTRKLVRQLTGTLKARFEGQGGAEYMRAVGQYFSDAKQSERKIIVTCYPSARNLAALLKAQGRHVRLFVADEAHQTQTDTVIEAHGLLDPVMALGFSATPYRSDTAQSLELWDTVAVRYGLGDALRDGVLVPWRTVNYHGEGSDDTDAVMARMILDVDGPGIANARTKQDADEYADYLRNRHGIEALSIHSGHKQDEQEARIKMLKEGKIKCLVHVNMLSEGVDFPWLMWLGMRRFVQARVRFAQELGRVLRCHPGKTFATLLDPHDLLGVHGIAHEPAIGAALDDLLPPAEVGLREPRGLLALGPLPPAVAIEHATAWCRHLFLTLSVHGIIEGKVPDGHWRTRRPSAQQLRTLSKAREYALCLPDEVREAVSIMSRRENARRMQRGAVSDLLSVLLGLGQRDFSTGFGTYRVPTFVPMPDVDQRMLDGLA